MGRPKRSANRWIPDPDWAPQATKARLAFGAGRGAELRPLRTPALWNPRRGAGLVQPGTWTEEKELFQNSLQIGSFGSMALPAPLILPPPFQKKFFFSG